MQLHRTSNRHSSGGAGKRGRDRRSLAVGAILVTIAASMLLTTAAADARPVATFAQIECLAGQVRFYAPNFSSVATTHPNSRVYIGAQPRSTPPADGLTHRTAGQDGGPTGTRPRSFRREGCRALLLLIRESRMVLLWSLFLSVRPGRSCDQLSVSIAPVQCPARTVLPSRHLALRRGGWEPGLARQHGNFIPRRRLHLQHVTGTNGVPKREWAGISRPTSCNLPSG